MNSDLINFSHKKLTFQELCVLMIMIFYIKKEKRLGVYFLIFNF
jgi:hypothetical protein